MNRQQQAALIWSRLPDLNIRLRFKTGRSDRPYELHTNQLKEWPGFKDEVRRDTASVFGNQIQFVPPVIASEQHIVATEAGTSARIVANMFQEIGGVLEAQGFNLRFGDSPAGPRLAFSAIPDAIIETLQDPGRPLVVGEFKTPWIRELGTMQPGPRAELLGIPIQTVIPRDRC